MYFKKDRYYKEYKYIDYGQYYKYPYLLINRPKLAQKGEVGEPPGEGVVDKQSR